MLDLDKRPADLSQKIEVKNKFNMEASPDINLKVYDTEAVLKYATAQVDAAIELFQRLYMEQKALEDKNARDEAEKRASRWKFWPFN